MHRVALLHTSHNELKTDMLEEVTKIERLLIAPLGDCRVCVSIYVCVSVFELRLTQKN